MNKATKEVTITEDCFNRDTTTLSEEQARILAEKHPVGIEICRLKRSDSHRHWRKIMVHTTLYTVGDFSIQTLTDHPTTNKNVIDKHFTDFEEAEAWVAGIIEDIRQNRNKIIPNIKQNIQEDEGFVIIYD